MSIDLSDNGTGYSELLQHIGHKLECVSYGAQERSGPLNVAIECCTCGTVLVDFNDPTINDK